MEWGATHFENSGDHVELGTEFPAFKCNELTPVQAHFICDENSRTIKQTGELPDSTTFY